jgi:hypothetical protein
MLLREDFIHYHMRDELRKLGWTLVAGQYPNGSDDDLRAMYVVDPAVARDRSPMPRHHSLSKQVPDLVAYKEGVLLVVEAKPDYDFGDEEKLLALTLHRRSDFNLAADPMLAELGINRRASDLVVLPALAFTAGIVYTPHPDFAYLEVEPTGALAVIYPRADAV